MTEIQKALFALQDAGYRDFQSKLMPTIDPAVIIGVRMPDLRKLAKDFKNYGKSTAFLGELPHTYYEENNLHGILLSSLKDFDETVSALDRFLPFVDNWATCDLIAPKVFATHKDELLPVIRQWMTSDHVYTIRFGIGMLMRFYLDEAFRPEYPDWVANLRSDEYYVNMMIAWYFATALAKQYEATLPFLENRRLAPWTHNKAIQKAIESYRVSTEQKAHLRTLKVTSERKQSR